MNTEERACVLFPWIRVTLAAALLLLTACGPAETDAAQSPPEVAPLRLAILDCGSLTLEDTAPFNLSQEEAGTLEMVVPCYLIEHPEGRLLWDLGLPFAVQTGEFEMPGGELELQTTVEEQLASIDLAPADIDYLAMSHLHFDHCGQANAFAEAHHLIQRAEYEVGFGDAENAAFLDRQHFSALENSETTMLDGVHDVFGDGRVVIHPAPGHTPGHQVLFVDLAETGPIVLSGDLYHFQANRELRRPPLFNFDAEQTLHTMDEVEALLEETGAQLWIQHDAREAATRKQFPEFYT